MAVIKYRRVVTGLNAEGQSCVIIDEPVSGQRKAALNVKSARTGPFRWVSSA